MASTPTAQSERTQDLFRILADPGCEDVARAAARDQLVQAHLDLAGQLARRFRNRGEPLDDLVQVARLGLVKAVDGFDAARGKDFIGYAVPTIVGELKRHFRDRGWSVRVPRRLKDLRLDVSRVSPGLAQDLGRMPTTADLAQALDVSEEEVRECALSSAGYATASLSHPPGGADGGAATMSDVVGEPDAGLDSVDDRESLRPLLAALPVRERRIIGMRYYEDLTQSQIAARVGISQMHVSRLLNRSLLTMRERLVSDR